MAKSSLRQRVTRFSRSKTGVTSRSQRILFGKVSLQEGSQLRPAWLQTTNKKVNSNEVHKHLSTAIIIAAAASAVSVCSAQSSASAATTTTSATQSTAPYTEGGVWQITMVKTKPGMSDDYLKALARIFKATNDEAKNKASSRIIKSWSVTPLPSRITIFCS